MSDDEKTSKYPKSAYSLLNVPNCSPKILRTSDSLNEGLPIKIARKSFKENDSFSIKKIVGSTLELFAKVFFSLD